MPVFRRLLALALITVLVAAAIPVTAQDRATITIGVTTLPTTLDPAEAYDFSTWEVLSHLYTGLVRQVPGAFSPQALAEVDPAADDSPLGVYGYELALAADVRISDDRLTYTLTLRDDATFSDGTPITAQTFVDSLDRMLTLRQRSTPNATWVITPYVDSYEATPDGELVFQLKRPVPYFLALLALPPYYPVHPDMPDDEPRSYPRSAGDLIGNGPYKLERFTLGEELVLTANEAYTLGPQPATPTIALQRYQRSQDLRNAIRDHQIDIAWRALLKGHTVELVDAAIEGLNVRQIPSTRVFYLYMNHSKAPYQDDTSTSVTDENTRPFSIFGVRQAVTLLLNRESAIDEVLLGNASPITSLVPDLFPGAYAPIWPDTPDPALAEQTLIAEGFKDTNERDKLFVRVETSLYAYGHFYTAAAQQLTRDSFSTTEIVSYGFDRSEASTTNFISDLESGKSEVVLFAWTPVVPHPHAYLRPLAHSDEPLAQNGDYGRDEIDDRLEEAARLRDPAAQNELYREVSSLLLENYDIIPVWQDHIQVLTWDDIGGVVVEPNFMLHYDLLVRK